MFLAHIRVDGVSAKLVYQKTGESDAEYKSRCVKASTDFITNQLQHISITYTMLPDDDSVEAIREGLRNGL